MIKQLIIRTLPFLNTKKPGPLTEKGNKELMKVFRTKAAGKTRCPTEGKTVLHTFCLLNTYFFFSYWFPPIYLYIYLPGLDCLYHESFTNCRLNDYSHIFRRHDCGGHIFKWKKQGSRSVYRSLRRYTGLGIGYVVLRYILKRHYFSGRSR